MLCVIPALLFFNPQVMGLPGTKASVLSQPRAPEEEPTQEDIVEGLCHREVCRFCGQDCTLTSPAMLGGIGPMIQSSA